MRNPTKFIGRPVAPERAAEIEAEGHIVKKDGHGNLRRVVGSPAPQAIHELPVIKALMDAGVVVIACGGGGAPVYRHPTLGWEGIDAVVDKDLAAAVLARDLGAELLLILTDVDAVYADWGTPQQRPLARLTIDDAARDGSQQGVWRRQHGPEDSGGNRFRPAHEAAGRSSPRSSRGQKAVHGEAGTTITATRRTREHSRVSSERAASERRRSDSAGRGRNDGGRGGAIARAVRRHGRGESAGARRRPRQSGRRQAGEDAGRGARRSQARSSACRSRD